MSHKGDGDGGPEINNNSKAVQQPAKKPKTSLINKLFKRKKPAKTAVTSSSSTESESEDQSRHLRFFSKRKSKRKSTGVKNVTEKFDHVVISPERKVQTLSANTSPYQIRHVRARLEYEHENNISSDNTNQTQEHLYINTTDVRPSHPSGRIQNQSQQDLLRSIANEQEYLRRLKISSQRRMTNEGSHHMKSNDVNSSFKRSNSGRGMRKDLPFNDSTCLSAYNSNQRNMQLPHQTNGALKGVNNRMHYRSDDNISRTYENSAMFDHLNGNLSSPSARRSHKHLSDDDNISLRRRNSKTEVSSSSENMNSNSLSRRSRAARNERYYKRLSRDHEMEKLVLPLSPKNKHKVLQQVKPQPMASLNAPLKINYAPRYPNFQKISQPYYNMNSTYPLPQSVGNSSRVSSSSSLNRTAVPNLLRNTAVNRSRLSSSSTSSYPQNSTFPPQQNTNLSRMSSSSTLSQTNSSNYPSFNSPDMRLVHAIPFKSVSYDSNINNKFPQPADTRDVKSMSFDNINQSPASGGKKIPPNPPPRNPNRKTIAIYEAPGSIVHNNQKRHSSHQLYDSNFEPNQFYQSDRNTSRLPYNEAYTGERAYLIKQAVPNNITYTSNPTENFIRNERSQYNVQPIYPEKLLQQKPNVSKSDQSYFHHKNNALTENDHFHPDSRYTNNDRLNEPNQYDPSMDNKNVQFYSATSKIITPSPQITSAQIGYENGEQLYENGPVIRAHNSSQQSKRPSSVSPPDPQYHKRSFTDQHFPDSQALIRNQRLTRSNETLPHDENFKRMNEIGIPVYGGIGINLRQPKVPHVKRPLKSRQSLEIKELVRPLSIVLEKSENELDSDRINNTVSTNSFSSTVNSRESNNKNNVKLNENGLRITRDGKGLMGSASNLDDALTELEQIYESLNLNDEDLLDRAERRDLPTCYQISKDQIRETPEVEEINRILGNSNNPNRKTSTRRIALADKINDDMAIRKYRYQKDNSVSTNGGSETGSYLLTSPTFSPPPFFEDKPASPVTFVDAEPDVTRDDVVYRNTKYVNNLLKVHDPQPFGIPLRPVINASSTDYLHATPDSEKYRSTFHSSKTPDVVMDDLAYRNLRKDYNRDCNSLTNFNLIPAFRSERDRNFSPLSDKDRYLSNLNDEERFQKKKKRAVRSLSGNLFMRDYQSNDSDQTMTDFLRTNGPSNIVRSETTSPEYLTKKCPILDTEFEKLRDRWLSTPSPDDMKRQSNRDKSLLNYIKENSNNKDDNVDAKKDSNEENNDPEEINISSEVESLRKKFVNPIVTRKQRTDKSNPFKKMLNDDLDLSFEIESIRKKFVTNKGKSENKNDLKSMQELEKSLHEIEYKNNFRTIKNQFDSSESKNNGETDLKNKSPRSSKKKSESKRSPKKIVTCKDNPYVSKFENIRNIFTEKNDVEEVKEIIKPKKKIKKFRETNNNSFATTSDYNNFKSNMDRSIDSLKRRLSQTDDPDVSNTDEIQQDNSASDVSLLENQEEKVVSDKGINTNEVNAVKNYKEEMNIMTKEDDLLQKLAKETTETSEIINEKLKQLSTKVVQHKIIKLSQFPITLDENELEKNSEHIETEGRIEKQSILKSAQTVSMESEYDNIPKASNDADRLQNDHNHEEAPNFEDLNIPQDTNVYEGLDLNNLVRVGKSCDKIEKENIQNIPKEVNQETEVHWTSNLPRIDFSKQISVTSEYDNVTSIKHRNQDQISSESSLKNKNKEILLKRLEPNKFTFDDDNEPFVSLTMKNIPPEDVESTTSDNEIAISELSDEDINSKEMDMINSYFQNDNTINTVGIKISEIKNLNFESDSSFNSEVQNIFNPQIKCTVDDDCTDSEIDNLPIDLQIEILENKSISSLENDSMNTTYQGNFISNDDNKDKYSIELEKTLDTAVNTETISDSLKTLCQSPVDECLSKNNSDEIEEEEEEPVEPEFSITHEITRQKENIETNTSQNKHSNLSVQPTANEDSHKNNLVPVDSASEKVTIEEVTEPIYSKSQESNNNDAPVTAGCSGVVSEELCDNRLLRSKSTGNVPLSNGLTKLSPQSQKSSESPTTKKPSTGFGKCCSSSSSSNLDLCSSETSSKSSNPCRDVTPVRRRRSLPESPVKALSLTNMCASLARPEGVK